MSGQFVGSRFGQDAQARIAASTPMLIEATDILPGEIMVLPLIPFYPGGIVSGSGDCVCIGGVDTTSSDQTPVDYDITFYQGDDVLIQVTMPSDEVADMSTWEWHAQVRVLANYKSTLVHDFITDAQFVPNDPLDPEVPPEEDGKTVVQLFLPRELNVYWGDYEWEMYSVSPADYSDFDKPIDWPDDEIWPPETTLRTWYKGDCKILLRTTTTDVLPVPPPAPIGPTSIHVVVSSGPMVVGPNGAVP